MKKRKEVYFIEDPFSDEKTIFFEDRDSAKKEFKSRSYSGVRFGFCKIGKHGEIIYSRIISEN